MKLRKKQKCAAVVLVCCILFQVTYYCVVRPNVVYATGAGGAIAGGAVAGLGLTGPEVAVAIAALFGVAAVVDNADTIYTEMNNCINKVTDGLENQAAVISDWWKEAAAGVVDTTSSVWKGVCNWFTGTRENFTTIGTVVNVKAGEKVNWINYGRGSAYGVASADCCCVEYWYKQGENSRYYFGRMWITYEKNAWITMYYNGHSTNRSIDYNKNYDFYYYNDSDGLTTASSENWKDTISKYLPNAYYLGQYDFNFSMTVDNLLSLIQPYLGTQQEKIMGGINKVLDENIIDDAADVIWPDTIVLNPDLAADEELASVLEKLRSGELTWTDCWDRVASGERVGIKTETGTYVLDNAGVTDVPYEKDATDAPPAADTDTALNDSLADYKTEGLAGLFPFCIPFDLINCIRLLVATGEAPCWVFPFKVPMLGLEETITIDLAKWDSVAAICRSVETLLFIGLLISRTREFVRG